MLSRKLPLALFTFFALVAVTFIYWWAYKKPVYGIDDANIYFVYMKHLAEGRGFVWTPGGERVEGFTSIFWTLIGAFCYELTPAHFPLLLLALNAVLTFTTVFNVLVFIRRLNGTLDQTIAYSDVLVLALLFFPLGFIEWSLLTLMETGLWLFLIVNTTLLLCNRYLQQQKPGLPLFTLMVMCMVVTRPEGLLFGMLFIFLLALQTFFDAGLRPALLRALVPLAGFALTAASLILWRLSYFGYPFPNTYYAKVSGKLTDNIQGGIEYLVEFFYNYPHMVLIVGALLLFGFLLVKKIANEHARLQLTAHEKVQATLAVVVFTGLGAPVLTGGDHFNYSRFYQAIVPLALIAFFNGPLLTMYFGKVHVQSRLVKRLATAVAVAAIFLISKYTWIDFKLEENVHGNRIFRDFDISRTGRSIAEKLNTTFVANQLTPSIGLIAAGGFGYAYKGNTVDLMGLNNTLMAHASKRKVGPRNHASFDINGFWKLQPDMVGTYYGAQVVHDSAAFFLPENDPGFHNSFAATVYKHIFEEPRFIQTYSPALVKLRTDPDFLFAYYNKAFLSKLDPAKYDVKVLRRSYDPAIAVGNAGQSATVKRP